MFNGDRICLGSEDVLEMDVGDECPTLNAAEAYT